MVKAPTSKNFSLGPAEYLEVFSGVKTGAEFTKVIHSFLCLFFCLYTLSVCMVIDIGHTNEDGFSTGCKGTDC